MAMVSRAQAIVLLACVAAIPSTTSGAPASGTPSGRECGRSGAGVDEACLRAGDLASEMDAESQEESEADLMSVELLQTTAGRSAGRLGQSVPQAAAQGTAPVSTQDASHFTNDAAAKSAQAAAPASAQVAAETSLDAKALMLAVDQNGHACVLCDKPPQERLGGKTYKAFRTDCGGRSSPTGPKADDINRPAVQFAKESNGKRNAFCELNFAKSCVDAVANEDYLYWAKSLDLGHSSMRENAAWDGKYCQLNGFLAPDVARLQSNFTGLRAKAAELCETKYGPRYNLAALTFKDVLASRGAEAPSLAEAERLAAWNCAMGDLGCDMAMCAYSFCEQSAALGGRDVGLYGECDAWDPVVGMRVAA